MFYRLLSLLSLCALLVAPTRAQGNGAIQGKVKERDGKALADVSVKIERVVDAKTKQDAGTTKTNAQGEFAFTNLPAGSYALTFELAGFRLFVTRPFEIKAGETYKVPRPVEMARERESHSLVRGAVLTSEGFSLPGVRVTIERLGGKGFKKTEKVSAEGGEFAFRVPSEASRYKVSAAAPGFEPLSVEVEVGPDEIRTISLPLVKARK
jgi:5-hydroxyisourate hydrolase-like protein (transthyretin family)